MVLAIDIGNTKVACGIWSGNLWIRWEQLEWANVGANPKRELAAWIKGACSNLKLAEVRAISVAPKWNDSVQTVVEQELGQSIVWLKSAEDFGIESKYSPDSTLGADRLANAAGALAEYSGPLVIVSCGTAITVDAVDANRVFLGGAIFAGPQFCADSLANSTGQIPHVELDELEFAIGQSTEDALKIGHFWAGIGAIESVVSLTKELLGHRTRVVSTGGFGALYRAWFDAFQHYHPALALRGVVEAKTARQMPYSSEQAT